MVLWYNYCVIVMGALQNISSIIQVFLLNNGILGILLSSLVIFVESIAPCMPLGVFCTSIFYSYGNTYGLLICWISTVLGCIASYKLCNKYIRGFIENKLIAKLGYKNQERIEYIISYINRLSLSGLTLIIACPFTPAFVFNIAAGLANVDKRKLYPALIIGKPFMIYFFGTIGVSLLESFNNPFILLRVGVMLMIAYALSKICDYIIKNNEEEA